MNEVESIVMGSSKRTPEKSEKSVLEVKSSADPLSENSRIDELELKMEKYHREQKKNMTKIINLLISYQVGEKALSAGELDPASTPLDKNTRGAWMATADILTNQKDQMEQSLFEKESLVHDLKKNITELQKETVLLKDKLDTMEKERDKWKHEKELLDQDNESKEEESSLVTSVMKKQKSQKKDFPSNETIIHNLLTAQIEFYFSDHHLKRDKPLMEKLCKKDHIPQGFISFDEVAQFPKVRSLGQDPEVVRKAVQASKYIHMKEIDGVLAVGRSEFTPPAPQQFPFRRTVFVYGIPPLKNGDWIKQHFECFGVIDKIKFDAGPVSAARKVGFRLLQKEPDRVTRLHVRDSKHTEFIFKQEHNNNLPSYICLECQRLKKFSEGYYVSTSVDQHNNMPYMFCIQCAAKKAEENLQFFKGRGTNLYGNVQHVKSLFGIDLRDLMELSQFRTCLIVFESQRQASKCVYVRSRLGIEGCFATHFHNYTRHKREICGLSAEGVEPIALESPMMSKEESFSLRPVQAMKQRSMYKPALAKPSMSRHRSAPFRRY